MGAGPQSGAGWSHQHRDVSGGKLRPIVFGAVDGLVTNGSLIAGVGGSGLGRTALILTGLAGLVAGAVSMATGEYISVANQNELVAAEAAVERDRHARYPARSSRSSPTCSSGTEQTRRRRARRPGDQP